MKRDNARFFKVLAVGVSLFFVSGIFVAAHATSTHRHNQQIVNSVKAATADSPFAIATYDSEDIAISDDNSGISSEDSQLDDSTNQSMTEGDSMDSESESDQSQSDQAAQLDN